MVLLDTHIWLWWFSTHESLSVREHEALAALAETGEVALSAISLRELQMLHARGRVRLDRPLKTWLVEATGSVRMIALDVSVVLAVDSLPPDFHGDPADRIIAATARAYDLPLATRDRAIRRSGAVRLWDV